MANVSGYYAVCVVFCFNVLIANYGGLHLDYRVY